MKLVLAPSILMAIVLSATVVWAASLKTDKSKMSYALGQQIGQQLKAQGFDVESKVLAESIDDVMKGKKSQLDEKGMQAAFEMLQKVVQAKREELRKKAEEVGKKNLEEGKKFLAANKKKKGIKTTKSGLQNKVEKAGKGKNPKATDVVKVHYRGKLLNGEEFDSSYKRNQPAEFGLNQVIKGWTEGLQLMKPGAKFTFWIPSELAYGSRGRPSIPANSTLVFNVELIEVVKPKK